MNIDKLSKADMIAVCRRVGIPTGDTARTKTHQYAVALALFSDQDSIEAAIKEQQAAVAVNAFSVDLPVAVELIGAMPPIALHPEGICPVGFKSVKELFGIAGKLGKMQIEVWNDPDADVPDPDYKFDKRYLERALVGMKCGSNVWLYGPAGTGKTEFVKNLAALLGRAFYRVSFDSAMERYEFIGGERMKNGSTVFQEGIVLQAIQRPGAIVLLDEPGFARPEYQSALHAVLEPNGKVTITETGKSYSKAAGVTFFAADNSNGTGDSSGLYVGVRQQNGAYLSRFVFVKMSYPEAALESEIIQLRSGCNAELADLIVGFLTVCRASAATSLIDAPPCMRHAFALAKFVSAGLDVRAAFEMSIIDGLSDESAEQMQQLFKQNVDSDQWEFASEGKLAAVLESNRVAAAEIARIQAAELAEQIAKDAAALAALDAERAASPF